MATAIVFSFRQGSRLSGDAQAVGEELERIRNASKGKFLREENAVVAAARSKRSKLHPYFEWDDSAAAEAHRLDQARHLIRSIVVIRQDSAGVERQLRYYVNVRPPERDENAYIPLTIAMHDPELRKQVIAHAIAELEAYQRKYDELNDVLNFVSGVEQALTSLRNETERS